MVHYLNDRGSWGRQGEEYLRRVRSEPPVRPLMDGARAAREARAG